MQTVWDERHGTILVEFLNALDSRNIKYFIIRGYEGLPNKNLSKDVDIMVEPGKEAVAALLLKQVFQNNNVKNLHSDCFGHIHCYVGMSIARGFSIHIDLVEGYISKGFEVFTFDELYRHVVDYNGLWVLDDLMNGVMLLVYKIFGYHYAKLKPAYQAAIFKAQQNWTKEFDAILEKIAGEKLGSRICNLIAQKNFDEVIGLEPEFTRALKRYTFKARPMNTIKYSAEFLWQKVDRILIHYKRYAKVFAVMAPDGTGKTTFLDALLGELSFYYVNDENDHRFHVYHFRPEILPNLGQVGEKAGVMKQDTNFTDPHRANPANPFSSLLRIAYYTLDYIIGWQKCVRNDVHYDRYTVFDRYSYDFIVDPLRTKLKLPMWVRRLFVRLTPQPRIVFLLEASPEVIYARKKELTIDEIRRQSIAYKKLALSNPDKFKIINAEKSPKEMADEAVTMILEQYTEKL